MYAKMQKLTETYRNHGMFIMQMGMESLLIIFRAEYMQVSNLHVQYVCIKSATQMKRLSDFNFKNLIFLNCYHLLFSISWENFVYRRTKCNTQ